MKIISPTRNARGMPAEERIYRAVMSDIQSGKLLLGDTLPSLKDLQAMHSVSNRAATYALRRLHSDGWIERRPGVGTFVHKGEQGRPAATSNRVGLVIDKVSAKEDYQRPLLKAIRDELSARGCPCDELSAEEGLQADKRFGCLVCVPRTPRLTLAPPGPCPVVYVAHDFEWCVRRSSRYDVVTADSIHGAALAGRRLRAAGCRDAIFVGVGSAPRPDWLMNVSPQRLAGFIGGWESALPADHVILTSAYDITMGAGAVQQWLAMDPRPDGVFCASDELAIGFQSGALAHNLQAGRDYSLIGFDAQPMAISGKSPITSVALPMAEMGRMAVRLALERAADPDAQVRTVALGCALFEGRTVKNQPGK